MWIEQGGTVLSIEAIHGSGDVNHWRSGSSPRKSSGKGREWFEGALWGAGGPRGCPQAQTPPFLYRLGLGIGSLGGYLTVPYLPT